MAASMLLLVTYPVGEGCVGRILGPRLVGQPETSEWRKSPKGHSFSPYHSTARHGEHSR
jgi:hypothetical protein